MTTTQNLELLLKALHAGEDVPLEILKDAYEEAGEPLPWIWENSPMFEFDPWLRLHLSDDPHKQEFRLLAQVLPERETGAWYCWIGGTVSVDPERHTRLPSEGEAVLYCERMLIQAVRQGKFNLCSPTM